MSSADVSLLSGHSAAMMPEFMSERRGEGKGLKPNKPSAEVFPFIFPLKLRHKLNIAASCGNWEALNLEQSKFGLHRER